MKTVVNHLDGPSRRTFLTHAAKSLLGVGALPWIAEAVSPKLTLHDAVAPSVEPAAKRVIYLYMTGGMSHLDTLDPKPGSPTQGPVETIDSAGSDIRVTEFLPGLAKVADKVAVINSLTSTQGAHAQGQYFMHTSYFLRGTIQHPHLGAYGASLLSEQSQTLPANVKIGGNSSGLGGGYLESKFAALPIGDPRAGLQHSQLPKGVDEGRFSRRLARARKMNQRFRRQYDGKSVRAHASIYADAVKLMKSEELEAFDISLESAATHEAYGDDRFAQGVLLARRLVEHDVRFVEVDFGGWDTHVDNFTRVGEKCAILDQALSALIRDLDDRGLLQETLVVLATEFGRTPDIVEDRDNGRNHYPKAFSGLLAGGGIKQGLVYGKTDAEGREVIEDEVTVPDFNATIAYAMGLPWDKEVISPTGRPFHVAADGQPILGLFA